MTWTRTCSQRFRFLVSKKICGLAVSLCHYVTLTLTRVCVGCVTHVFMLLAVVDSAAVMQVPAFSSLLTVS